MNAEQELSVMKAEEERRLQVDATQRAAQRAIALAPGREAAAIEFTRDELQALERLLMGPFPSNAADERREEERRRVCGAEKDWHPIFCKVAYATQALADTRKGPRY